MGTAGSMDAQVEGKMYGKRDTQGAMAMYRQVRTLTEEIDSLSSALDAAQTELLKKKAAVAEAGADTSKIDRLIDELKPQVGIAQAAVNQYDDIKDAHQYKPAVDKDVLVNQTEEVNEIVIQLQNDYKKMRLQLQAEERTKEDLQGIVKTYREQLLKLHKGDPKAGEDQMTALKQELKELNERLQMEEENKERAKNAIGSMNAEIAQSQRQLLTLQLEQKKGMSDMDKEAMAEVERVSQELETAKNELRDARVQASQDVAPEAQKMMQQIQEVQDQVAKEQKLRDAEAVEFHEAVQKKSRYVLDLKRKMTSTPDVAVSNTREDIGQKKAAIADLEAQISKEKQYQNMNKKRLSSAQDMQGEINAEQRKMLELMQELAAEEEEVERLEKKKIDVERSICEKLGAAMI